MTKIRSSDEIKCPHLKDAYERALGEAFDNAPYSVLLARYDSRYGNHVTTKGTLVGIAACRECSKRVEVTLNLPRIEATSIDGQEIKLFDALGGRESISLSGHKCAGAEREG